MTLNTNIPPYYDDFDDTKGFHQILFVPKNAVQVRELNQMQSILQNQIERFGSHIFSEGAVVVPGETNFDTEYPYVKVTVVNYDTILGQLSNQNLKLKGLTSGVEANLVQVLPITESDPITFYVMYTASGFTLNEKSFADGELVNVISANDEVIAQATVQGTGVGSKATVNAGVYYIQGKFVYVDEQTIVLDRYDSKPSYSIGFDIEESFITSTEDASLFDNASGTSNYKAPGAHRYYVGLKFNKYPIGSTPDGFVEIMRVKDGVIQKKVVATDYSTLTDTLARRTYDESGDYTVNPFGMDIREHLNTGSNGGLLTAEDGGDSSKFVVGVEEGKAYVRGYEITNLSTQYIHVDKARDVGVINNSATTLSVGNYIVCTNASALPKSNTFQTVTFYSGTFASAGSVPSGTILGTAKVRYGHYNASTNKTYLFLFDVKNAAGALNSSFISSALSVYMAGSPAFTATVASTLIDSVYYSLLYKLPVDNIKTLLTAGESDSTFSVVRQYTATTDTSGVVILTAGVNEVFASPSTSNSSASYLVSTTYTVREISSISTLGGTELGQTLTINFGVGVASTSVTINVEVIKKQAVQKTKSPTTLTITKTLGSMTNGVFTLSKADVYKIDSITEDGIDVTSSYTLYSNVSPEYYGVSYIKLKSTEAAPTHDVIVTFKYFAHGSGDYFSVDSYSTINYEDIPKVTISGATYSLSDVIDFRPRINDAGTLFSGTGSSVTEVPIAGSLLRCDIQHYLPRIDKVYLTSGGVFSIAKGASALSPTEPKIPDGSMALCTLIVPAYTGDITKIAMTVANNKRYTMRDIGKLETRIANLEYYVTLSMLETETETMQIVDSATGLNRFKNGFVTDNFIDHSVGNYTSTEYRCAVSEEEKTLRPEFHVDQVNFDFDLSLSSGVQKTGSLITLPYTEVEFLTQASTSGYMNVNPYAVYRWNGEMSLSPNSDTWYDSVYTEPSVTYQLTNNGNLVQSWNSWGLNWTGSSSSTETYILGGGGVDSGKVYATTTNGVTVYSGINTAHNQVGSATSTTNTTSVNIIGDRVVKSDVIPYMRSRDIAFNGVGLMPYCRVYAFFDNVNVSVYCKQNGKSYGEAMITDADGNINGIFTIPNNDNIRFRVGTKQFTLIDNEQNIREASLTYADDSYTARGTLLTRTQSIIATKDVTTTIRPWDPLAQSFFVEKSGGVFLTSVELYFQSKDPSIPVSLQIRNMVNGSPGQEIVPYSTVLLKPNSVNVTADGSVSTKFTFESPVYLAEGNEYCYVVMSNSNRYNVYIATMGQKIIGANSVISKQPFIGVLFKSQNNTTWSADQTSDMKFKINIAKFNTGVVYTAAFVNEKPDIITLDNNPLSATASSNVITANVKNHGLFVGSKVAISGVVTANGIPLAELNKTQTVTEIVNEDTFKFNTTTNSTATGSFGGAVVKSSRNLLMNTIQPIAQELLFNNTNIDWTLTATTGKSINGTEVPYVVVPEFDIVPNENTDISAPLVVASTVDSTSLTTTHSAVIRASITTDVDNVSPVIDVNRVGLIGVSNRINNPVSLSETSATGGNASARYITNVIGLSDAANSLKVFVDINKPQYSDVKMYYRVGNTSEEVTSSSWVILPTIVSVTETDINTFNEAQYGVDDIADFSFYQFKIVMLSSSSSFVPRLKRFRGIALGT